MNSSRPFLNMLNPMGRQYQGYTQANQSLLEEEDEEERSPDGSGGVAMASSSTTQQPHRHDDSDDDEVPQSFMIEGKPNSPPVNKGKGKARRNRPLFSAPGRKLPILPTHTSVSIPPRPSEIDPEGAKTPRPPSPEGHARLNNPISSADPVRLALWQWANVTNLDAFLQDVYYYYEGKGMFSIALARGLNLLTVGFVIGFSTFIFGCIDYSRIHPDKSMRLSDAIVDRCVTKFSGFTLLFFLTFTAFYVWQIVSFVLALQRLRVLYNFYTHLLKIPDVDIQTISWPEIVRRIGAIREDNPNTALSSRNAGTQDDVTVAKLDAHDIANRILRQENYLTAIFNKDLLDLRVPVPSYLERFVDQEKGNGKRLTQALEWNLRFCLMEYLFDENGQVRRVFLNSRNRGPLIQGLKRRFIFMGILNAIFVPFIVLYLLIYSFFRYFEQYHKDPSTIGGRRYTSYAQWKFREFNELPHLFIRRLDESYPAASMYIGQFPNEKVFLIMRFVAFVSGSFAAVLFLATVWDPDIFVHLEVTPHRSVLFYLSVFGSIVAVARGMIPEDNRVFDPEMLMTEVIAYTHYMPEGWRGQIHSKRVHQEFGELFQMKVLIFVEELMSVVLTPLILWYSLPNCAPAIIDFFREFSVHVDGRGYVCSFAEFNFERHGNVKFGAPAAPSGGKIDRKMVSNEGKMEKSFLNFKAANPDWNPSDPSGSAYLNRMAEFTTHLPGKRRSLGESIVLPSEPVADRAHEYDRALRQSQIYAAVRRKTPGAGSMLGASTFVGGHGPGSSSIFGPGMAQTVALGDSQGSVQVPHQPYQPPPPEVSVIPEDDFNEDGGVGSGLGGSYVDGARRARVQVEEEKDWEDNGVLGLLAQIYERRDGPSRRVI